MKMRGFTLIELLVAIGVMALMAGLSWRGLDGMARTQTQLTQRADQVMTLQAGDAILTGTPAGIGATRDPRLWLSKGDCVEVSAGPLGTLVTTFDN